jgi:hypothetical protein
MTQQPLLNAVPGRHFPSIPVAESQKLGIDESDLRR